MNERCSEENITVSIGFRTPAQNLFVLYKESCQCPGFIYKEVLLLEL